MTVVVRSVVSMDRRMSVNTVAVMRVRRWCLCVLDGIRMDFHVKCLICLCVSTVCGHVMTVLALRGDKAVPLCLIIHPSIMTADRYCIRLVWRAFQQHMKQSKRTWSHCPPQRGSKTTTITIGGRAHPSQLGRRFARTVHHRCFAQKISVYCPRFTLLNSRTVQLTFLETGL